MIVSLYLFTLSNIAYYEKFEDLSRLSFKVLAGVVCPK